MIKTRVFKISLFISVGIILIIASGFILKPTLLQNNSYRKYEDQVGYLDPDNPDISLDFKRCSDKLPIGFYHSTAPYIYKGDKPVFKKLIQSNFSKNNFTDNGYLNFRFLINCKGDIGDIEINELNTDLEVTTLNKELVTKLSNLTLRKENWSSIETREVRDFYMYILYKIENGQVVEILP